MWIRKPPFYESDQNFLCFDQGFPKPSAEIMGIIWHSEKFVTFQNFTFVRSKLDQLRVNSKPEESHTVFKLVL